MSYRSASPTPREGSAPRSLYLPSFSTARDSVYSYEPSGETLQKQLQFDIVPITPGVTREKSHFSPTTPVVERGLAHKDGHVRSVSLPQRIARALSWKSAKGTANKHDTGGSAMWLLVLLVLLVLVILFLFANVIYLDIRMSERTQQLAEIAARLPSAGSLSASATASVSSSPSTSALAANASPAPVASASSVPVVSASSSPSPSPPVPSTFVNLATLNQDALSCVTQFPLSAATDPVLYCARCMPALFDIPMEWFVAQTRDLQNGSARLQRVSDAAHFCTSLAGRGAGNS